VGPEALAGGPIGKIQEGDWIQIVIDRVNLHGSIDLVGCGERRFSPAEGAAILQQRPLRSDLHADANLPADTKLWAALQRVGGGTWGGCVYDVEKIVATLAAGEAANRDPL
jgi:dihydroxyacid dehydratase/phosphogluconate dehydratase